MDCVGYGDSIQVGGGESAPSFWNIAKQIDTDNDRLLVTRTWKAAVPMLNHSSQKELKHYILLQLTVTSIFTC